MEKKKNQKKKKKKNQRTLLLRKTSRLNNPYALLIAVLIIGLLIGYGFGFVSGMKQVAKYVVHIVFALKREGVITADIDEEFINAAIFQYRNHVGGCLFTENITLEYDN